MKKYSYFIFLFLFCQLSKAQVNLVQNGSFENFSICPNYGSQISYSLHWWGAGGTPDYFNSCSNSVVNVPFTYLGYQLARTGNAFAGIVALENYEYIQTKLNYPLLNNKKYCIEFFVIFPNSCTYAIDRLGALFSKDTLFNHSQFEFTRIIMKPQVVNNYGNIIKDTVNWMRIYGEFYAEGGEQFLTIGNFFCNDSINIDTVNGTMLYSFYFIDDISVYEYNEPVTSNKIILSNAFTPNGDGVNDVFRVQGQNIKTLNGKILNRWCQELYNWTVVSSGWDGKFKGKDVPDGTYFYAITAVFEDGETKSYTGSILLSR